MSARILKQMKPDLFNAIVLFSYCFLANPIMRHIYVDSIFKNEMTEASMHVDCVLIAMRGVNSLS